MKSDSLEQKSLIILSILIVSGLYLLSSCKTSQYVSKSQNSAPARYRMGYDDSTLAKNTLPLLMPYNKIINPAGKVIRYGDPDLENHALNCTFDPKQKYLAVIDRYGLAMINPNSNAIIDRLDYTHQKKLKSYENTFSGLTWYQRNDSSFVLSSVVDSRNSHSYVLMFYWDGKHLKLTHKFRLPAQSPAPVALPNALAVSHEGGRDYLFVVCNGNNTLVKFNLQTGKKVWSKPTGMVPYGLTIAGHKIYVSNWGGARPTKASTPTAGAPWGAIQVDTTTGAASSGTVSVLNLENGNQITEIPVGLHPNDIISNKTGTRVYVANGNSGTVSVINTNTDQVAHTIPVKLFQKGQSFYGDTPNALALSDDGQTLYVANGMDDAIA
ncbi:MAG TPA: YncE family protein, partial [Balneolaceae bacterium]|nr:YncE family protein [Balneolaceae bacterium]